MQPLELGVTDNPGYLWLGRALTCGDALDLLVMGLCGRFGHGLWWLVKPFTA